MDDVTPDPRPLSAAVAEYLTALDHNRDKPGLAPYWLGQAEADLRATLDAERARYTALVAAARALVDDEWRAWYRPGEEVGTVSLADLDGLMVRINALRAALSEVPDRG